MRITKTIKKVLMLTAGFVVGSGMLTLLIAANNEEHQHICKKFIVTIKGSGSTYVIDKGDVIKQLRSTSKEKLIGKAIRDFNLTQLEEKLKINPWIGDANIYFDSQDAMHVLITEKDPVARVFTTSGRSFYLDSGAHKMPLMDKVSLRLPVFTNFPDGKITKATDSALLNGIKQLVDFINRNPFWSAQIAQIDITENNTFEAIPVIGDHIIRIGKADNLETKFNKLFVFYQKVLSKTGFDKYSILDIQFDNQIVATHKGVVSPVDSIQLQRNIQALLYKNNLQLNEELEGDKEVKPEVFTNSIDTTTAQNTLPDTITSSKEQEVKNFKSNNLVVKPNPSPVKPKLKQTVSKPKPVLRNKVVYKRKPKAVMRKRTAN